MPLCNSMRFHSDTDHSVLTLCQGRGSTRTVLILSLCKLVGQGLHYTFCSKKGKWRQKCWEYFFSLSFPWTSSHLRLYYSDPVFSIDFVSQPSWHILFTSFLICEQLTELYILSKTKYKKVYAEWNFWFVSIFQMSIILLAFVESLCSFH